MLLVLSCWLLFGTAFVGLGLAAARFCGVRQVTANTIFISFWTGWSLALGVLQVWHLFLPVNGLAAGFVLLSGCVGVYLCRTELRSVLVPGSAARLMLYATAVALVLWLASRACGATLVYDSGLYHLTNIRWINHYALVPGIGNLHVRLGFSNTYFLYPALLNCGPWKGVAHHLPNGLLLAVFLLQSLHSAARMIGRDAAFSDICRVLLAGPAINEVMRNQISSPSPDLPVFLLGAVAACALLDVLLRRMEANELRLTCLSVCAVCLIGIAIKLSFVALGACCLLLATSAVLRRADRPVQRHLVITLVALSPIVVGAWVARELIMTGYVGFPASFLSVPFDWRVERSVAHEYVGWIRSWARTPFVAPDRVLADWSWFVPWLKRMTATTHLYDMYIPLTGTAGAILLWLALGRLRPTAPTPSRAAWLVVAAAALHLVYWFFGAPDVRFVGAGFWIAAALTTALAVERLAGRAPRARAVLTYGITIGLIGLALAGSGPLLVRPDWRRLSPPPPTQVAPWLTDSGLTLYVPTGGDQCFDAPLPCTPMPKKHLRLRREGDIGAGFTTAPAQGAGN